MILWKCKNLNWIFKSHKSEQRDAINVTNVDVCIILRFCGRSACHFCCWRHYDLDHLTRLRNRFKTASSIAQYPLCRWTVSRHRGGWRPSGCCVADLQRRANWLTGISGLSSPGLPVIIDTLRDSGEMTHRPSRLRNSTCARDKPPSWGENCWCFPPTWAGREACDGIGRYQYPRQNSSHHLSWEHWCQVFSLSSITWQRDSKLSSCTTTDQCSAHC